MEDNNEMPYSVADVYDEFDNVLAAARECYSAADVYRSVYVSQTNKCFGNLIYLLYWLPAKLFKLKKAIGYLARENGRLRARINYLESKK